MSSSSQAETDDFKLLKRYRHLKVPLEIGGGKCRLDYIEKLMKDGVSDLVTRQSIRDSLDVGFTVVSGHRSSIYIMYWAACRIHHKGGYDTLWVRTLVVVSMLAQVLIPVIVIVDSWPDHWNAKSLCPGLVYWPTLSEYQRSPEEFGSWRYVVYAYYVFQHITVFLLIFVAFFSNYSSMRNETLMFSFLYKLDPFNLRVRQEKLKKANQEYKMTRNVSMVAQPTVVKFSPETNWKCQFCHRPNKGKHTTCTTCGAVRGRKPVISPSPGDTNGDTDEEGDTIVLADDNTMDHRGVAFIRLASTVQDVSLRLILVAVLVLFLDTTTTEDTFEKDDLAELVLNCVALQFILNVDNYFDGCVMENHSIRNEVQDCFQAVDLYSPEVEDWLTHYIEDHRYNIKIGGIELPELRILPFIMFRRPYWDASWFTEKTWDEKLLTFTDTIYLLFLIYLFTFAWLCE